MKKRVESEIKFAPASPELLARFFSQLQYHVMLNNESLSQYTSAAS